VWPSDAFDGENGADALRRQFVVVERRDTGGRVLWETGAALAAHLDAYRELTGPLQPPAGPYPFPFRASSRNCVSWRSRAADAFCHLADVVNDNWLS
jgi:hypothetical protein